MKVESIKIKNFKAISDEHLEINGNNVYVLGPNGVGKSSFLDAIFKVISGKEMPSKLTKEQEKNGYVEIDLGNIIVKSKFTSKEEKAVLSIESKDGSVYKTPRKMLDELAGIVDFDLNSFFALTPKKQVDFIKQLVGIDFTDLDDEYNKFFKRRTYVNSRVEDLEAQSLPFDNNLLEKKDYSELNKKLAEIVKNNSEYEGVERRIKERESKIEALEKELAEQKKLQHDAQTWLFNNEKTDTSELEKEISEISDHNEKVDKNLQAKKIKDELKTVLDEQTRLNAELANIEDTKRRVISDSKLPVDGLTFDDNQLYYNSLPFEKNQINTAQLIIIGLQLNLALLKEVRIARFDGTLLDNSNIELVNAWAKENDLQLFVEFVERDTEGLKIEVKEN